MARVMKGGNSDLLFLLGSSGVAIVVGILAVVVIGVIIYVMVSGGPIDLRSEESRKYDAYARGDYGTKGGK